MTQPQGFIDSKHPEFVCKLQRSLYGLKQVPQAWNERFTLFLLSVRFKSFYVGPSLFVKHIGSHIIVLLLYVDDIILTGDHDASLQDVIYELTTEFDMKDLGLLHYFLGLQIKYQTQGLFMHQSKYVQDLLQKIDML